MNRRAFHGGAWLVPGLLAALAAGCGPAARAGLVEDCAVADATLLAPRAPIDNGLARAGRALLYQEPANRYALLQMPGCRLTPLADVAERVGLSDVFLLPSGARLFSTLRPGQADLSWWHAAAGEATPVRLSFLPDPASRYPPVLSDDGAWVAWPRMGSRESFHVDVVMRHPDGQAERIITLTTLAPGMYGLLQLDTAAQELTLVNGLSEFIGIGFDDRVRWREQIDDVAVQPGTFVRLGRGYFAWDAAREQGPYRVGWSMPPDRGTLAFERLREIEHAAIDPTGRYAAITLATQYGRLLTLTEAAVVVRLSDRRELSRIYVPTYSRANVAFLTDRYVAYSDASRVHVLRLP